MPHKPERHAFGLRKRGAARDPYVPEPSTPSQVPAFSMVNFTQSTRYPQQAVSYGGNGFHWFTRYRPGESLTRSVK